MVRRAFTVAAAAGLAGALLFGLLLAGRLIRRLRRLRDTALRLSDIGPQAELKPDDGRDEIGDLSRAFATMQHRLREQEQARRAFVATASHELRTPLASLSVMLDMLVDDLHAEPADVRSARTQAANAEAQVQRLSLLSAELLDLSRIDAGIPLRSELVELPAVRALRHRRAGRARWRSRAAASRSTATRRCGPSATRAAWPRSCASCWTTRCATRHPAGASASEPRCATAWPA